VAAPYRTVDTLAERLGSSIRVHRRSASATVVTLVIVAGLLVPPYILLANIVSGKTVPMTPFELFLAPTLCCVAIGLLVALFRARDLQLDLRTHGFVHRVRGVETGVPWEEVTGIAPTVGIRHTARAGRFGYTITTKRGARIEIPHTFEGMPALSGVLETQCVRHLLPVALAEIEARGSVAFGPFSAARAGLSFDGRTLSWSDVKGAAVVRGMLAVGDKVNGIGVFAKRDGIVAWAKAPYVDVPDGPVLLALVEHCKRSGSSIEKTG
jgi:hypothetical protein